MGKMQLRSGFFSLVSPHAREFSLAERLRRQRFDPHAKAVSVGTLDGARDMSLVHHVAEAIVMLTIRRRPLPPWLNLGCGLATGLRQLELCEEPLQEGMTQGGTLVADTSRLVELGLELPTYTADALVRLALGLTNSTAPAMNSGHEYQPQRTQAARC